MRSCKMKKALYAIICMLFLVNTAYAREIILDDRLEVCESSLNTINTITVNQ